MLQLSNTTAQTLQPGQSLAFDNVVLSTNDGICFNKQAPNTVKLCARGNYDVTFHANITGAAAAALQLAIALSGYPNPQTAMNAVPAAEGDLENVSAELPIRRCCCDLNRLAIVNSGTTPVTIAPGSSLVVKGV